LYIYYHDSREASNGRGGFPPFFPISEGGGSNEEEGERASHLLSLLLFQRIVREEETEASSDDRRHRKGSLGAKGGESDRAYFPTTGVPGEKGEKKVAIGALGLVNRGKGERRP